MPSPHGLERQQQKFATAPAYGHRIDGAWGQHGAVASPRSAQKLDTTAHNFITRRSLAARCKWRRRACFDLNVPTEQT